MDGSNMISVVVPAYNLSGYIEHTLQSVLDQSELPDEVIIVDDGSDDDTVQIVENIASTQPYDFIRLFRQERKGPGAARNRCIQEARGEWIAFLDGDDIWLPDKIREVRAAIRKDPDTVIIAHDEYEVDLRGNEILKRLHSYYSIGTALFPQLYRRCFFSTSCMTVRKRALLEVGGFDTSLPSAQDYELWLRLARYEKLVFIPIPLAKYILRPFSISANIDKRLDCTLTIARRHLPFLKGYLGAAEAFRTYLTVVLIHYYAAIRAFRTQKRSMKVLGVVLGIPGNLIRPLMERKTA